MTLREKRHQQVTNTMSRVTAQRDACLANLVRYQERLKKLDRQRQRLEKAIRLDIKPAPKLKPEPIPESEQPKVESTPAHRLTGIPAKIDPASKDDLSIPDFLRRKQENNKDVQETKIDPTPRKPVMGMGADAAARTAENAPKLAEQKKLKTRSRIAKLKAAKSGATRQMPLTGRAALEAIRQG